MQKGSLAGRMETETRARNVLEAVSVMQQADFMTWKPTPGKPALNRRPARTVLTGHPDSKREEVALNAIEALIKSVPSRNTNHLTRCRIIAGSKGIGKSHILRCIGQAAAILDFANEGMRFIPAYVATASPMTPLSHMAVACLSNGVLLDEYGEVPAWAALAAAEISRGKTFVQWCEEKAVYPVLLIDEASTYQGSSFEIEVKN